MILGIVMDYTCLWDNAPCYERIWRGDYAGLSAVLVGLEGQSSLSLPGPAQKAGPVTLSCKAMWSQNGPCQHEQPGPKKSHCAMKLGKPANLLHFSSLTPPKLCSSLRHLYGFYHHVNIKPNNIYSLISWNIISWITIMKHAELTILPTLLSPHY